MLILRNKHGSQSHSLFGVAQQFDMLLVKGNTNLEESGNALLLHRRLHAAQKAEVSEIPALIYTLDRDAAAIAVVDSNLHREHILPSEKAFAYKLKSETLKHQGQRKTLEEVLVDQMLGAETSSQLGTKYRSDEMIAQQTGESRNQVQRYIRLACLISELLQKGGRGKNCPNPGGGAVLPNGKGHI